MHATEILRLTETRLRYYVALFYIIKYIIAELNASNGKQYIFTVKLTRTAWILQLTVPLRNYLTEYRA